MSYKEILDNVSNIENLDNVTILKILEKFSKTIKDFAVQQTGLQNLLNVEFEPNENGVTYSNGSVDYLGNLKITLADNIFVNKPCSVKFNIKGSETIIVDVDEFDNALEIHLDNATITTLDFAESERQKCKNLLNIPNVSTQTLNGVTLTIEDNIITLNGTTTGFTTFFKPHQLISTNVGKYAFSFKYISGTISGYAGVYTLFNQVGKSEMRYPNTSVINNITSPTDYNQLRIAISENITFDNFKYSLQYEQGDVATDYQPYNGAIVHEKQLADVEHIETIYDMSSSDSNINQGLTSGIQFNANGSNKAYMGENSFSKYKGFYVTLNLYGDVVRIYVTNLNFEGDRISRSSFCVNNIAISNNSIAFGYVRYVYSNIYPMNVKYVILPNGSVQNKEDDVNYTMIKVEGVLR